MKTSFVLGFTLAALISGQAFAAKKAKTTNNTATTSAAPATNTTTTSVSDVDSSSATLGSAAPLAYSSSYNLTQYAGLQLVPTEYKQVVMTLGINESNQSGPNAYTSSMNNDVLQAAVGLKYGFYAGAMLEYGTAYQASSIGNTASSLGQAVGTPVSSGSGSYNQGLSEPQLAVGYHRAISNNETLTAQLAYDWGTGSNAVSVSNLNISNSNISSTMSSSENQGGAAFLPSVQLESKSLFHMTTGARVAYYMPQGRNYSLSFPGTNGLSGSANLTGGNVITAVGYAQRPVARDMILGVNAGLQSFDKTHATASLSGGGTTVNGSGTDIGGWTDVIAGVNLSYKVAKKTVIVPEVDYSGSTSSSAAQSLSAGVSGQYVF